MAQSIGNVVINLEANTAKLVDGFNRAERAVKKSTQEMKNSVVGLTTAYISLSTAVDFAKYFMKQADAMTTVESRLRLVTKGADDLLQTQKALFQQAQSTRTNYVETADLYQRIARSTQNYNIEQKKVLSLTDSISKAMTIGGGTAESQKAALMQLGQAFSANFKSVGQEFASIREQAPSVWQAMVEGAGVSEDVFRKMAEDGQLSTEKLVEYFEKAKEKIDREFSQMTKTMSQGMMVISNSFKLLIDTVNKETGLGNNIAEGFIEFSKVMEDSIPNVVSFIKTMQDSKETIIAVGEAFLVYKGASLLSSASMQAYNSIQANTIRIENQRLASLAQQTALENANAEALSKGTRAVGLRTLAENARIEAQISGLAVASKNAKMWEKEAILAENASKKATAYAYSLESSMSKASVAVSGLGAVFKSFAPTAILFGITEVFLNWDKITGNVKQNLISSADELGKMTKYQLSAQTILAKQSISSIEAEMAKLSPKTKGFSYFGTASEEDITMAKAQYDALKQKRQEALDMLKKIDEAQQNLIKTGNDQTQADKDRVEAQKRNIKGVEKTINETLNPLEEKITSIKKKWDEVISTLASNQPKDPTQEQAEQYKKTLEDVQKARAKEETEARESFNKKDIKETEDWVKKKADLAKELSILQQDEFAKPYILLTAQYEEDMRNAKSNKEAQLYLTEIYNAKVQELNKDTVEKFNKQEEEALEKKKNNLKKELDLRFKIQEEMYRIQEKQAKSLTDVGDRETALAKIQYDRNVLSFKYQLEAEEMSLENYKKNIEYEDKLLKKTTEDYTLYGQVINNVASSMENSFMDFFDATEEGWMDFGKLAKGILKEIYLETIRVAMVKPLVGGLTSGAMGLATNLFSGGGTSTYADGWMSGATGVTPSAHGNVFGSSALGQYSNQVVSKPTFFAFANGGVPNLGVMGEAGREAIMPLTRTSNGDLGVKAEGMGLNQVKIQIINESGTQMEVTKTSQTSDVEGLVIQAWISGISKNRYGSRDILGGK